MPLPPRRSPRLELLLSRAGDVVGTSGDHRHRLEGRVRHRHLAGRGGQRSQQALGDDPQSPKYIQTVPTRIQVPGACGREAAVPPVAVATTPAAASRPSSRRLSNELLPWSVAIVASVLSISALWYSTRLEPAIPPVVSIALSAGDGLSFDQRAPCAGDLAKRLAPRVVRVPSRGVPAVPQAARASGRAPCQARKEPRRRSFRLTSAGWGSSPRAS